MVLRGVPGYGTGVVLVECSYIHGGEDPIDALRYAWIAGDGGFGVGFAFTNLVQRIGYFDGASSGHDDYAVAVSDNDVARMDEDTAGADGNVDLAGAVHIAGLGDAALGEDGHAGVENPGDVADDAVGDHSDDTAGGGDGAGAVAPDGALDIARLDNIQGLPDQEVVSDAGFHGDGGPTDSPRGIKWLDPVPHGVAVAERIGDEAGGRVSEPVQKVLGGPVDTLEDSNAGAASH